MQRESSIDDQVRNCTNFAQRNHISIAKKYYDQAISGAVSNRPQYQQMLADAEKGAFKTLLVDDLSRLSRDDIEMKKVLKRMNGQEMLIFKQLLNQIKLV